MAGADFAIESVRVVFRREHLSEVPSGVSWQGLRDIFRETLAAASIGCASEQSTNLTCFRGVQVTRGRLSHPLCNPVFAPARQLDYFRDTSRVVRQ